MVDNTETDRWNRCSIVHKTEVPVRDAPTRSRCFKLQEGIKRTYITLKRTYNTFKSNQPCFPDHRQFGRKGTGGEASCIFWKPLTRTHELLPLKARNGPDLMPKISKPGT